MTYPRQNRAYNVGIHDPLWVIANGALVDGVSNGITDGSGGVVYLLGFNDGSGNFVDESRFAFTDAIAANSGVKTATQAFDGQCFRGDGSALNASTSIAGRTQLKFTTSAVPAVTAFTFEYYFKINPTGVSSGLSTINAMVLNYGADKVQFRSGDESFDTSDFHYIRDTTFTLYDSTDLIDRDVWHHFCVENKVPGNSPRTLQYYFDGVQVATRVTQFSDTMPGNFLTIIEANGAGTRQQSSFDEVRYTKGMYRYGANFTPNPPVGGLTSGGASFLRG